MGFAKTVVSPEVFKTLQQKSGQQSGQQPHLQKGLLLKPGAGGSGSTQKQTPDKKR